MNEPLSTLRDGYDVIVIGGGPAGTTAATLLGREGRRVAIFDREHLPRYHIGESLLPSVLPFLEELDALDAVKAAGFHRKTGQTFRWGEDRTPWSLDFRQLDVYPYAFFVERGDFDHILWQNAARHGADARDAITVDDVVTEGPRVVGVTVRDAGGATRGISARYVLDTSGQNALLARKFGTRRWVKGLRNLAVWSYWEGAGRLADPGHEHILTEAIEDGWIWVIPLRDGLTSVGIVTVDWTRERAEEVRRDLDGWYEGTVRAAEGAGALLAGARRVDAVRAQRDWSYCTTRFYGPGYCLAGDAACFVDPILSTGVHLAMTGGYLAALAMNSALARPHQEAAYLRYFQRAYVTTYRELLTQVRYFYRVQAHRDSIFWKSKRLLKVDPQLDGALAFLFMNSGLARHVTSQHPHDIPGQARALFPSLQDPSAEAVPYRPRAASRELVPAGTSVVLEGTDRRLYRVTQRGFQLHLEPGGSPRWRDRPPGTAALFELALRATGEPLGTVLIERDRPDLAPGVLRRRGLACSLRHYRSMDTQTPSLTDAAESLLATVTEADVNDLVAFEARAREALAARTEGAWALASLPPVDSVARVEHPVSAEFRRARDGASLWVIVQTRRDPRAHESPYARTRLVDVDYSTGSEAAPDDDALGLVGACLVKIREAVARVATLSRGLEACQEALLASDGVHPGWSLVAVRRVAPNRWADDTGDFEEDDATDADEGS